MSDTVQVRPLGVEDYHLGFFETLSQLTTAPLPTEQQFVSSLMQQRHQGKTVLVAILQEQVIGTVSCLVEHKFIHGCAPVMHIEDLVVHSDHRKRGVARLLLEHARQLALRSGCYKTILNCAPSLQDFYEHAGFRLHGLQMAIYH